MDKFLSELQKQVGDAVNYCIILFLLGLGSDKGDADVDLTNYTVYAKNGGF